jgi:tRNA uridine 5-carboxymethylaminomethyl modification enzyme
MELGVRSFDVIIVGAGHAGIEAALASARMGLSTACITLRLDRIGHLPCNCSIGGPAKGHIAREVDALGGQMGVTTDYTLTHIRRVGTGKGPAVQTIRAQVCKLAYPLFMRRVLEAQDNLTLIEGAVEDVLGDSFVTGVVVESVSGGEQIGAKAVVLTTGTFMNGLCHEGQKKTVAARYGDQAVFGLSKFLIRKGVRLRRFKTGTTPRVRLSSIDLSQTEDLPSEPEARAVSFLHDRYQVTRELLPCYQTRTTLATHKYLKDRLHESAMYSGQIEGVGPRYCPSIEDKIVRFAHKSSHPIFLEIEAWDSESVYVQGFSTSMPAETQLEALRTVPGLASVEMIRPGYAVEYDMADPLQLDATLMSKQMSGLFLAGQLNGTSGYEEAAGQGIVAGINAARFALGEPEVVFGRDSSFIGVMIDDLVTKGVEDPYRMLTARAEHRLLLRSDNADQRLTPTARELGLCSEERWERFTSKMASVDEGLACLRSRFVSPVHDTLLAEHGWPTVDNRTSLFDLLKRPSFSVSDALVLASLIGEPIVMPEHPDAVEQIELAGKYDGYIVMQRRLAKKARLLDGLKIPVRFDYEAMKGLSYETKEKLSRIRPTTVGQASRVPGVRPSDIALLIGHIRGSTGVPKAGK